MITEAFEQQDQAADKIVENVLQPEPDPDAERPEDHRQRSGIDPQNAEGQDQPQPPAEIDGNRQNRILEPTFERPLVKDFLLQQRPPDTQGQMG